MNVPLHFWHGSLRNFSFQLIAVLLAIDELVDGGVVLEADANNIVQRVALKNEADVPLDEQTVAQVLHTATDKLKWSLLK